MDELVWRARERSAGSSVDLNGINGTSQLQPSPVQSSQAVDLNGTVETFCGLKPLPNGTNASCVATRLYRDTVRFDSFGWSMVNVFTSITGVGWTDLMYAGAPASSLTHGACALFGALGRRARHGKRSMRRE